MNEYIFFLLLSTLAGNKKVYLDLVKFLAAESWRNLQLPRGFQLPQSCRNEHPCKDEG